MDDQDGGKKESRAARVPEKGRRATMTFRCLPDVQAQLQSAAEASGRSVSEEIERRLEASFNPVDPPESQYYKNMRMILGGDNGLIEAVELGIYWVRIKDIFSYNHSGDAHWFSNEENFLEVEDRFKSGIRRVLRGFAGRLKREDSREQLAQQGE
jgi:hypothetical protein